LDSNGSFVLEVPLDDGADIVQSKGRVGRETREEKLVGSDA